MAEGETYGRKPVEPVQIGAAAYFSALTASPHPARNQDCLKTWIFCPSDTLQLSFSQWDNLSDSYGHGCCDLASESSVPMFRESTLTEGAGLVWEHVDVDPRDDLKRTSSITISFFCLCLCFFSGFTVCKVYFAHLLCCLQQNLDTLFGLTCK